MDIMGYLKGGGYLFQMLTEIFQDKKIRIQICIYQKTLLPLHPCIHTPLHTHIHRKKEKKGSNVSQGYFSEKYS